MSTVAVEPNAHAPEYPSPLEASLALIERLCTQPGDDLGDMLWSHVNTGGKRVRARLALTATRMLGTDVDRAVPWAAATELLHNASLVHDDLQDGDAVRRGEPALWTVHGPAQAINAGDLGLMLAYSAAAQTPVDERTRFRLMSALAHHSAAVVRGQAAELQLLPGRRLDRAGYDAAVLGKTSALFSLPVLGAALIARRPPVVAEGLSRPFARIGLLFQIQDDVLDLYGDKQRGRRGNDLREGKVSSLVVEHLRLRPEDRQPLLNLLETPRALVSEDAVARTIDSMRDSGALAACWQRMDTLTAEVASDAVLATEPRLRATALALVAACLDPVKSCRPEAS